MKIDGENADGPSATIDKKLLSDSVVYGISGAVSRLLGLLSVPLLTRTSADYGTVALGQSSLGITAVTTVGLDASDRKMVL